MIPEFPGGISMEARFDIRREKDIMVVSAAVREYAESAGFNTVKQYMAATAVSELATNIFLYAGHGCIRVSIIESNGKKGIEVCAKDNGPGIADLDLALEDDYSTSGGLGVGLPGTRRLMDEFEIKSGPGRGTRVMIRKWL